MYKDRDPLLFVDEVLDSISLIHESIEGFNYNSFSKDKKTHRAVIRCFEVIGEAIKNIPKEALDAYPGANFSAFARMRDKLIHNYFGVDLRIVWETIINDLPPLKENVLILKKNLHLNDGYP